MNNDGKDSRAGAKRGSPDGTKEESNIKKTSTQENKEEKITGYLAQLKKSHSDKFSLMQ